MESAGPTTKQRKERAQLSCTFCRHRKLKCNREQPCDSCVKRNRQANCYFARPQSSRVEKSGPLQTSSIANRVEHLEGLILNLMENGNPAATGNSSSATPDQLMGSYNSQSSNLDEWGTQSHGRSVGQGLMRLDGDEHSYVSGDHWAAILDDIAEVRQHLDEEAEGSSASSHPAETANDGPELLFGLTRPLTKAELLTGIPASFEADRLISRYLACSDPLLQLIHVPTFQKQYERFWVDQMAAPSSWLAMLYCMLCTATLLENCSGTLPYNLPPDVQAIVTGFRRKVVQCLIHSNYTKPKPYTLEAFLMYNALEYMKSPDTKPGVLLLFSISCRLALQMGYHRDPKYFPSITPFQGEMRRRVLNSIKQLDALASAQAGLPRMLPLQQIDTEPPRNLHDEDFSEATQVLPPNRPTTEYTPILYHIAKSELTEVFRQIVDGSNSPQPLSYPEIMRLDEQLAKVSANLPDSLKPKPLRNCIADAASIITRRFNLDLLFHKARCILHRRYLLPAKTNPVYSFSQKVSFQSATAIIEHQLAIYNETLPGGRLQNEIWLLSGLATDDFVLAAMIICLDLDQSLSQNATQSTFREEFIDLLKRSHKIWQEWVVKTQSIKATKASLALGVMLRKIQQLGGSGPNDSTSLGIPAANRFTTPGFSENISSNGSDMLQNQSTMNNGAGSQGSSQDPRGDVLQGNFALTISPNDAPPLTDASYDAGEFESIEKWLEEPDTLDWGKWDGLFVGGPPSSDSQEAWDLLNS